MITLTAKIDLITGNNDTFQSVASSLSKNNISSEIGAVLGFKRQSKNPFIFGVNKFGDETYLSSGVDYFIGSKLSDENGKFGDLLSSGYYSFRVVHKGIKTITIAFDTTNDRHPHSIVFDDITYYDDDSIFTIQRDVSTYAQSSILQIGNWNTPNSPLVISGIYADITIDIDYKNLISINGSIFERGETKLPSYGIISNNGELEFNDIDGEIKDYADLLLVNSDLKVVVTLKNTLANKEEQVGVFQTETWNYDNDNRSVSVSLKDDLEEWQDIQVKGFSYDPREPFKVIEYGKMSNVYKWLQQQDENGNDRTPQKYDMLSFEELDIETQTILENTTIDYPLLEDGTLWEQWTKLCEVCGLYIYKRKDGKTVCSYTYGS